MEGFLLLAVLDSRVLSKQAILVISYCWHIALAKDVDLGFFFELPRQPCWLFSLGLQLKRRVLIGDTCLPSDHNGFIRDGICFSFFIEFLQLAHHRPLCLDSAALELDNLTEERAYICVTFHRLGMNLGEA